MPYYAVIDGKQEGPFTEEQLRQKIGTTVDSTTLVWKEGMQDWLPLSLALPDFSASPANSSSPSTRWTLASLGSRFLAALVDGGIVFGLIILMAVLLPLFAPTGKESSPSPFFWVFLGLFILLILALAGVQIFMLVKYSQTIGKRVLGIRIYNHSTGERADWVKTIVLRGIVNSIPSSIPLIGGIYALVDILFIFRQDRRCIHDLIAGTVVGTVPK